jgi:transposase
MASARSRERVARNFVKRYGAERFRQLLMALGNGESGQTIAETFEVSRERVRQWKNTFGTVVTLYQVHPEIQAVLEEG